MRPLAATSTLFFMTLPHPTWQRVRAGATVFFGSAAWLFAARYMAEHPEVWDKVGPYWRRYRLGTLMGWQSADGDDPITMKRPQD